MEDGKGLTKLKQRPMPASSFFGQTVPRIIAEEGPQAIRRFLEFFTANIRNKNTRKAYLIAVTQFSGGFGSGQRLSNGSLPRGLTG